MNNAKENAAILKEEYQWLSTLINNRLETYFQQSEITTDILLNTDAPDLNKYDSMYANMVMQYNMSLEERIVLLIALAPHIQPQLFDLFCMKNATLDKRFTEMGGITGKQHSGFIPTGETALFMLAANDLERRFKLLHLFSKDHFFRKNKILYLQQAPAGEPMLSGVLSVSAECLHRLTIGDSYQYEQDHDFPAKRITTPLEWKDFVITQETMEGIMECSNWILHGTELMQSWGAKRGILPGYRTVFHGVAGTGKKLAATLLGKSAGRDVYRVDLSAMVSKYLGETETHLSQLFDLAANKNWILFFDEADVLLGKNRISNDLNHDHIAACLCQLLEEFPGVVIFSTSLIAELHPRLISQLQSIVHFPLPSAQQRKILWSQALSDGAEMDQDIDLDELAARYEMTGGAIIHAVRYALLMALKRGHNLVKAGDLAAGIRKEFSHSGKSV